MDAERDRDATLMGLEVRDEDGYGDYRAAMAPILAEHGGRFEHDFVVSRVLRSNAGERINRVFVLSFPDRAARARFFADARYLAVRAEHFEPAVARAVELGKLACREKPEAG